MYDFPEEIPGQMTPEQMTPEQMTPEQMTPAMLQQYAAQFGIELTDDEAEKLEKVLRAATQDAGGGGSIGATDLTSPTMDVTRGPPLSAIGVRAGGADNMLDRDRMMQQLIRRPGYQGLGY
jgi:hypothetical protein